MNIQADEGYYFGIGAFETIALEHGRRILFERHMERLERTVHFLGLPVRPGGVECKIEEYLKDREADLSGHDALKIVVSEKNTAVSVRRNPYADWNETNGFRTVYSEIRRNETSPLIFHKTLNYAENLLERRRVQELGYDEAVFLNGKGEITEGTVSNVFFVKDHKLYTPPVACGMLPGVMRAFLCEKYKAEEAVIRPEDVEDYDEMFLTNSLMGIMPVESLGDHHFATAETTERLRQTCCPGHFDTLP